MHGASNYIENTCDQETPSAGNHLRQRNALFTADEVVGDDRIEAMDNAYGRGAGFIVTFVKLRAKESMPVQRASFSSTHRCAVLRKTSSEG